MYALVVYSLKTGACLAVFCLFFKLLLSRETFHRLNRVVVLAAVAASFLLPLCVVTIYRELPSPPEVPLPEVVAAAPQAVPSAFPWRTLAVALRREREERRGDLHEEKRRKLTTGTQNIPGGTA